MNLDDLGQEQDGQAWKLDQFDVNLGVHGELPICESDDILELKPRSTDAIKFHVYKTMPNDCHRTAALSIYSPYLLLMQQWVTRHVSDTRMMLEQILS